MRVMRRCSGRPSHGLTDLHIQLNLCLTKAQLQKAQVPGLPVKGAALVGYLQGIYLQLCMAGPGGDGLFNSAGVGAGGTDGGVTLPGDG